MLTAANRRFLSAVSKLQDVNPFLSDMLVYERQALGDEAQQVEPTWSMSVSDPDKVRENTWKIMARLKPLLNSIRAALAAHADALKPADLVLYEDALLYHFYYLHYPQNEETARRLQVDRNGEGKTFKKFSILTGGNCFG